MFKIWLELKDGSPSAFPIFAPRNMSTSLARLHFVCSKTDERELYKRARPMAPKTVIKLRSIQLGFTDNCGFGDSRESAFASSCWVITKHVGLERKAGKEEGCHVIDGLSLLMRTSSFGFDHLQTPTIPMAVTSEVLRGRRGVHDDLVTVPRTRIDSEIGANLFQDAINHGDCHYKGGTSHRGTTLTIRHPFSDVLLISHP